MENRIYAEEAIKLNDYELLDALEVSKCIGCTINCTENSNYCPYSDGDENEQTEDKLY